MTGGVLIVAESLAKRGSTTSRSSSAANRVDPHEEHHG